MKIAPWQWLGVVLAVAGVVPSSTVLRSEEKDLVPAAFGIWTDRAGSSWSVEASGNISRIGSTMVNSGLALLIDEEKFTPQAPLMTPDGKELVINGTALSAHRGLRVQRRVRILGEPGGLRYVELFHNESGDPVRLSVGLTTSFSGNFKTFLSDRGRSEPLLLGPAETGVMVLPGASQSSRAFLFTLAGSAGGENPTISSQNRYGLTFRYPLSLGPGESAAIVHHVAQIVVPQSFDRRTLLDLCRPYALDRLREGFDPAWAAVVSNAEEPPGFSARSVFASGGFRALGLAPEPTDLLAAGEGTRLPGKAEGGPVKLISVCGLAEFPLDRIAGIAGAKVAGPGRSRVYLRDGQVLSGALEAPGLAFLPTGGSRIALDPATLDRLVFSDADNPASWPEPFLAMIETRDGDRIGVPAGGVVPTLPLATPWGVMTIAFDELLWLAPAEDGMPGYRAELRNGTRVTGLLDAAELKVALPDAKTVAIPASRLKTILTREGVGQAPGERAVPAGTTLGLAGGETLVGSVSDTTLSIQAETGAIETALAEVRRLVRLDAGTPAPSGDADETRFRLERWDGGTLVGTARVEALSVEVAGRTWQIPLREIESIDFASPSLDAATLAKIAALVRNLGSPDWATRESATRELGAFGYLARTVLQRELAATSDPEVERRLERILEGMN
jgi:hypothetical protein